MAEIRAVYKRSFQVRPYETETVELSVTDEIDDASATIAGVQLRTVTLAALVRNLHGDLAEVGDKVVLERMLHAPEKPSGAQRVLDAMTGTLPPDPWSTKNAT